MFQQCLNLKFFINNQCVEKSIAPDATTLQILREELGLTGAKEVCTEGDCGACTIALGKWEQSGQFVYRAINSCLLPAAKLHGCHVITIEGLAEAGKLHPIQQLMLENHAVQCGYCTSGMIMTLFCLFANNQAPTRDEMLAALEGNLCRCTGYQAIYKAGQAVSEFSEVSKDKVADFLYPAYVASIKQQLQNTKGKEIEFGQPIALSATGALQEYHIPKTLDAMFGLMQKNVSKFKIINGGTDLMVLANVQHIVPQILIDISKIAELNFIEESDGSIVIGGNVTLDQLHKNELIAKKIPILQTIIARMASQQVRNIATIAGNIANASPIADAACVLLGLGARITLQSRNKSREVEMGSFCCDYKLTVIDPDREIIGKITIPLNFCGLCSFEKTAKRSAMDIAAINSIFNVKTDNQQTITFCRVAFGGVAKFPMLAKACSEFLIGKKMVIAEITKAADIAVKEFTPISDVRGSSEYRRLLTKNHLIKHFARLCK